MAKRIRVLDETRLDATINYVKVRSLIDGRLLYDGKVSNRHYEWSHAGATIDVLSEDVPELLSKRLGGNLCCGGSRDGNKIFEVVGDSK